MNILVINYEYPPLGGGGGAACRKLAEEYVRRGHHVECVTTQYGSLPEMETEGGVAVHRVKVMGKRTMSAAGMLSLLSFPVCAYRYAVNLCRNKKFDCIHTHFSVPSGPLGACISKKFKIPNVLSLHGGDVYDPTKWSSPHKWRMLRRCNEWVFKNADHIAAQSWMTKEKTEYYYKTDKDVDVIPCPYDRVSFRPCGRRKLGMDEDKKYIVSVGRLVKRKGFDFLIRTMRHVRDASLIIIGSGPEYGRLKGLAASLGLDGRVALPGARYGDVKHQYLANSDLFVLSSIYEPFGIVLQEAMQAGLPIISTNDGGQGDLIEHGVNGLLVDYGDEEKLAECIKLVLSDGRMRKRMQEENRERIKNYSSDIIAGRYLEILSRLVLKNNNV